MTPSTEAETRYLLGAELAQAGHYDRAAQEMRAAVQMQPGLHTASLQLGLLLLTMNKPSDAIAAWQPLDRLDERAALRLFKGGLEALIHEDFELCIRLLTQGIAANTTNPALNRDMNLVIARARDAELRAVRTDFSLYNQ
jgi:tetratricopeptide (TPR) repeat protein